MKPFKNKTAFVTGASKGIGYACALRLAEGGANVFLSSSNEERLRKASQEINKKTGVEVGFHASDLRQLNGCIEACLLYTSPSPRDQRGSRMPSSA